MYSYGNAKSKVEVLDCNLVMSIKSVTLSFEETLLPIVLTQVGNGYYPFGPYLCWLTKPYIFYICSDTDLNNASKWRCEDDVKIDTFVQSGAGGTQNVVRFQQVFIFLRLSS